GRRRRSSSQSSSGSSTESAGYTSTSVMSERSSGGGRVSRGRRSGRRGHKAHRQRAAVRTVDTAVQADPLPALQPPGAAPHQGHGNSSDRAAQSNAQSPSTSAHHQATTGPQPVTSSAALVPPILAGSEAMSCADASQGQPERAAEPGDEFGLDVAERLLQRMAEPPRRASHQRREESSTAAQGDSTSPHTRMIEVLHGEATERRAQEILARHAAMRAKFLSTTGKLNSAAAAAGQARAAGARSPTQQDLTAEPTLSQLAASPANAANHSSDTSSPQHCTDPRCSPDQPPPGSGDAPPGPSDSLPLPQPQQAIHIYCSQLVLNSSRGAITLPAFSMHHPGPGPGPVAWTGVPVAVPVSSRALAGGGAGSAAPKPQQEQQGQEHQQVPQGDGAVYFQSVHVPLGAPQPSEVPVSPSLAVHAASGAVNDAGVPGMATSYATERAINPINLDYGSADTGLLQRQSSSGPAPAPEERPSSPSSATQAAQTHGTQQGQSVRVGVQGQQGAAGDAQSVKAADAGLSCSSVAELEELQQTVQEPEADTTLIMTEAAAGNSAAVDADRSSGSGGGSSAASAPEPKTQLAAELTRLIMEAFQQSGGVIRPVEGTKEHPAVPATGVATTAAAVSDSQPQGPAGAADQSAAAAAVGPPLATLPSTLPNAAIPRGSGPSFLQIRDIELTHPAEDPTAAAGTQAATDAILAGLGDWEAQAMAALQGRSLPASSGFPSGSGEPYPASHHEQYHSIQAVSSTAAAAPPVRVQPGHMAHYQLQRLSQRRRQQHEAVLQEQRERLQQTGMQRGAEPALRLRDGGGGGGDDSDAYWALRPGMGAAATGGTRGRRTGSSWAADTHGSLFPPQQQQPVYLTGPGVERQPHPLSPLQRRMHGEADPRKQVAAVSDRQHRLTSSLRGASQPPSGLQHEHDDYRYRAGSRPRATVTFAEDTLGGGSAGLHSGRLPYQARVSPEAAAVHSLAGMVAQRLGIGSDGPFGATADSSEGHVRKAGGAASSATASLHQQQQHQSEERDRRRGAMLDEWAAEVRQLSAATSRAEATQRVAVASAQQALTARRERQAAELADIMRLLGEVDEMARGMEEQTHDTRKMMQELEEEAELRQVSRLNELLFEAQKLGSQVDAALQMDTSEAEDEAKPT
ncbi:hypothetical protein Agub_g750, partial [Astrephomene gubernaculifera]